MIKGGYYIKAKKIGVSEIAHAAPVVREIWDYLLREAETSKGIFNGTVTKHTSEIQEALHWMVGFRRMVYTDDQCEGAIKWLSSRGMINYTKTGRGLAISICKYGDYQELKNYEGGTAASGKRKPKEGEIPTLHWNKLVDVWFKDYKKRKGTDPTFEGKDQSALKAILKNLQSRSEKAGEAWSEETAVSKFQIFLDWSYAQKWIADHYLLANLYSQFDAINAKPNGETTSIRGTSNGAGIIPAGRDYSSAKL